MLLKIKKLVGKVVYKLLISYKPDLQALEYPYALKSTFIESEKENFVRIYPVHKIFASRIGAYTYIARNATINHTQIGRFCSIGPNFISGWGIHPTNCISTSPMFYSTKKQNGMTLSDRDKIVESKPITIGNDVFIGMNVILLDGVNIGDGAVIGAGSIVTKDIPPYAVAVGNPAKIIKYRFSEQQIDSFLKLKWWDWPAERLKEIESAFESPDMFLKRYSE